MFEITCINFPTYEEHYLKHLICILGSLKNKTCKPYLKNQLAFKVYKEIFMIDKVYCNEKICVS